MRHYEQTSNLRADIRAVAGAVTTLSDAACVELLTELARRIRARMSVEEDVLFTAIEKVASLPTMCAIATFRAEHGAIRDLLREIEQCNGRCQRAAIAGNLLELDAVIRQHDLRESKMLPPIIEKLLDTATIVESLAHLDAQTA